MNKARLVSIRNVKVLAVCFAPLLAAPALADGSGAFTAPASAGFATMLGSGTTGVFELQGVLTTAASAIILLTLTMVGIVFVRKIVRKFTG